MMKATVITLLASTFITLYGFDSIEKEKHYYDYIQGSIGVGYVQPFNGDTYINTEKQDIEAVGTIDVDLFLLPSYYGGLYIGYKKTLSDVQDAQDLVIEKRYNNFSIYYRRVKSAEDIMPLMDNDISFIDSKGNAVPSRAKETNTVPYEHSRYELRWYGVFDTSMDKPDKPFGYISFFYEDVDRLLIGRDEEGKLTKDFYTEGKVNVYSLSIGIKQRDYELGKGFFMQGAFDLGVATMNYTDTFAYGDNGIGESPVLAWGMDIEAGYNFIITEKMRLVTALYGGYTTAGDSMSLSAKEMYSQGNVGLKASFAF